MNNYTPYCSRCKATDKPLMVYATSGDKKYYKCRDCQNSRATKYYATPNGKKAIMRANVKYWQKKLLELEAIEKETA